MTNTKFRLLEDDTLLHKGVKLYRIEALKDFGDVEKREKGGYISGEECLCADDRSWVYDNSIVIDSRVIGSEVRNSIVIDSRVSNSEVIDSEVRNSIVIGSEVRNSRVIGSRVRNSRVIDSEVRNSIVIGSEVRNSIVINSRVSNSRVIDSEVRNSRVIGSRVRNSRVSDSAKLINANISSSNDHFVVSPIGSEEGVLTAFKNKKGKISVTRGCFAGMLKEFELAVEQTHGDSEYAKTYRIAIELIKNKLKGE